MKVAIQNDSDGDVVIKAEVRSSMESLPMIFSKIECRIMPGRV